MTPDPKKSILIGSLQKTLAGLIKNPCQHLENPAGCPRRASVALIIRIRPNFDHWPEECSEDRTESEPVDLNQFFSNPWVQYGDPEVAFIKRASREGDRWTSHVALPGGKRDPEDKDDQTVAVRETAEEIGLDLTSNNSLFVGSLSERLVSTAWGKVPYVYVYLDSHVKLLTYSTDL
ncbi:hypothetical protein K3495_g2166 [Podosphaera aphanis]|nr:hypothetical protein K3495_g2166 [Podosphaera aphanis]